MKTIVVTGGAGFIGSHFLEFCVPRHSDTRFVCIDKMNYAGNPENLSAIRSHENFQSVRADILDPEDLEAAVPSDPDVIVNFAAASHVDRSIEDAGPFVRVNVQGVQNLLDVARSDGDVRFVQISTDEVYGSLGETGRFTPDSPLDPSSPYAATKAGGDLLAMSYHHTYGLPVIVVRCSNNYGPRQHPEKFIPRMILRAMNDQPLPIYGDGSNVRDWIFVKDFCRGILDVLEEGEAGKTYHFGGRQEKTNLDVARAILDRLDRSRDLIQFVEDRPGHDYRYAMDFSRTREELGWSPTRSFEEGLGRTIGWYRDHSPRENAANDSHRSETPKHRTS